MGDQYKHSEKNVRRFRRLYEIAAHIFVFAVFCRVSKGGLPCCVCGLYLYPFQAAFRIMVTSPKFAGAWYSVLSLA